MSAEAMSESEAESAADSSVRSELYTGTIASSDVRACTEMTQEEDKKNFYPVTWRVLGGGVTLGGRRTSQLLTILDTTLSLHVPRLQEKYVRTSWQDDALRVPTVNMPTQIPVRCLLCS